MVFKPDVGSTEAKRREERTEIGERTGLTMSTRYYTRVIDKRTGRLLYEYDYTFETTDEVIEDVHKMIRDGFIPHLVHGYTVEIYDVHPDVPGAAAVRTEKI